MSLRLVDVLGEHWESYAQTHQAHLVAAHYRAVRRVLACRTPELGGHLYGCGSCQKTHYAYHSCNHRSCPQCGALDQQIWSAKQEARLLPVPYFMITFTLPSELRSICHSHPKEMYALILKESAEALKDIIATKYKGATPGFTSVLHTWGRQIQHHPHVHSIVPAVAHQQDTGQLIHPKKDEFLIHFKPLTARFRNRIKQALQNQHPDIYTRLSPAAKRSLHPPTQWNVKVQHVGTGKTALRYLARYVQKSAFSESRLIGYDRSGKLLIRWTCSHTKKPDIMKLTPHEFIRRWLIHVLPKGFARVRHYGFQSSAAVKTRLKVRALLGEIGEPTPQLPALDPFRCSHCGGELIFLCQLERLPPHRGPPTPT